MSACRCPRTVITVSVTVTVIRPARAPPASVCVPRDPRRFGLVFRVNATQFTSNRGFGLVWLCSRPCPVPPIYLTGSLYATMVHAEDLMRDAHGQWRSY